MSKRLITLFTGDIISGVLFFGVLSISAISASAQDAVSSEIASKYKDKLVVLHSPYCGKELNFDADAILISTPTWGDWKTCQGMRIRNVRVEDNKIKVTAQRVPISYDCGAKQVHDLSEDSPEKNERTTNDKNVSIEVQLPPNSDKTSALNLMDKLFRPPDLDIVPGGQILRVGPGVSAPVAVYTPDPSYSDEARKDNYEGTVLLTVIVGADGLVHSPTVTRSLGMGLDEKAIEKVKIWRFKPATVCGNPTAVQVNIEITFNLDHQH